jgi:hypothetical protein
VQTTLANIKTSITSKLAILKLKNDVQLPANEIQTKQPAKKRSISIKQDRRRSRKVFPGNHSTPGDTKFAEEANQYAFNMEKMKSRTAIKQAMYRPAEEICLPEVSS